MKEKVKLEKLVKAAQNPLYKISTVFPFDLFPDKLTIDTEKITIVRKFFFLSKKKFPILINDIKNVTVTSGPLFASINFEISGFEENPEPLKPFPKDKAVKAKRIILGLMAAKQEDIDFSKLTKKQILSKVMLLGKSHAA